MKFSKKFFRYLSLTGLSLIMVVCLIALANHLIQKPGVQQYLIKKVFNEFGINIQTGKMVVDILHGPGVLIHDVKMTLADKAYSFNASDLHISFNRRRLFTGKLSPVSVDLKNPVMEIPESALMNYMKIKEKEVHIIPVFRRNGINTLHIENGELIIRGPSGIMVHSLTAGIEHAKNTSNTFKISGDGKVEFKGEESVFNTSGIIDINPDDLLSSTFSAYLKTENTFLAWIPLPAKHINVKKGFLDSNLNISGSPEKGVSMSGSLGFKALDIKLVNKERSKNYNIPELNLNLTASIKDKIIHIDSLDMKAGDIDLDVKMLLDLTKWKNPYIKLNAKSEFMPVKAFCGHFPSHITPSWLEEKLFPMFEDGIVQMDKLVMDGTFEQFKEFKDDGDPSIFNMSLSCKSFIISNMGIRIPFTDVSASVDIRDGNLKISGLSGAFGVSRIKEGSLDVQGMANDQKVYKVFVEGDFDIRELMTHREMYVVPEKARQQIDRYKDLEGRLIARTTILYQEDWDLPRILNGDFSFVDTLYHRRPLDIPLRFNQMDFHFSGDGNNTFEGNGVLGETRFSASGTTLISGSELFFTHAGIKASADINQLIGGSVKPDKFPILFKEPLPLDITMEKEGDTYRYYGKIDTERFVMNSESLVFRAAGIGNSISFDLTQHDNGKLDLNNIVFKSGNSRITVSGECYLTEEKLNSFKVMTTDLSLEDFVIQFIGRNYTLSGSLDADMGFSFFGKNLSMIEITGNLTGKNMFFSRGVLPLPVSEGSFRLDLSGKKGFINRCDVKFGDHPLHMKGILRGWDRLKADLLVTTDYIDLTELVMSERDSSDNSTPPYGKPLLKTADISLKINASKGIWRKLEFKRLNAEMNFTSENITLKNVQAELDKGDVSASGKISRGGAEKINISGMLNLDSQPADKFLSDMDLDDMGIKGTVTLNSTLSLEGDTSDGLLKILSGKIEKAFITKGLLKNSRVFLKILDFLNIPDKFKERPPEMKEQGFYFENIEGTAVIDKGILKTDGFVMKSPAFNAAGSGEENLYMQTHDIRLLVQPLGNIDFIISYIPIVGRILVGDNETLFTIGYDVKGSWNKPDLSIVPMENLKGLLGVFKRMLLTPYKIIENINNAAKSMKKPDPEEADNMEPAEPDK